MLSFWYCTEVQSGTKQKNKEGRNAGGTSLTLSCFPAFLIFSRISGLLTGCLPRQLSAFHAHGNMCSQRRGEVQIVRCERLLLEVAVQVQHSDSAARSPQGHAQDRRHRCEVVGHIPVGV